MGVLPGLERITSSGVLVRNMSFKFRENWNYILGAYGDTSAAVRRPDQQFFLARRDICVGGIWQAAF